MEKGHDLGRKLMPQIMSLLAENMGDYYDKITNETGTFTIDDNGVLTKYQSTMDNQVQENVWRCLDIPEGVWVVPEWAFRDCEILERLTFPKSLRIISTGGAGAFSWSQLPHVGVAGNAGSVG